MSVERALREAQSRLSYLEFSLLVTDDQYRNLLRRRDECRREVDTLQDLLQRQADPDRAPYVDPAVPPERD